MLLSLRKNGIPGVWPPYLRRLRSSRHFPFLAVGHPVHFFKRVAQHTSDTEKLAETWSAANGGLRESEGFSSVFWNSQVLFGPCGKGQKKGDFGRFPGREGRHPLNPQLYTPISGTYMTGRPGDHAMEMDGGSTVSYLTRTPRVPLFMLVLVGLDFQGRRGITSVIFGVDHLRQPEKQNATERCCTFGATHVA